MKCGGESRSVGEEGGGVGGGGGVTVGGGGSDSVEVNPGQRGGGEGGVTVGRETGDITVDLICDVLEFKLYAAIIIYMK